MKYKRILLKLSGESLMGEGQYGIDNNQVLQYAQDIKGVYDQGLEIDIVVGGGNIFRGLSAEKSGMERAQADYMGMLATVINCMALQNALESIGVETRLQSAIKMEQILPERLYTPQGHPPFGGRKNSDLQPGTGNHLFYYRYRHASLRAIRK